MLRVEDRPRCVALARLLLEELLARTGVELPASALAVEALDGGDRGAPALAWSALHEAPDGAGRVVARAVARLVEHGIRPVIGSGAVRGDAIQALQALGVGWRESYDVALKTWDGAPPQDGAG